MRLAAVGLSHHTAAIELRESVDFAKGGLEQALAAVIASGAASEAVILSTCNRSEIYAVGGDAAPDALVRFFADYHGVPHGPVADHLYVYRGAAVARHLFRVSAGLDSLVVGEPQILGQVKSAYAAATERHYTGALTNRLFHTAFAVGKRVRSETGIGEGAVSVSYAAIALARKIFGDLADRRVLIAGAGEMAELTGVHLGAQGVREITIASRTRANADALAARLSGRALEWEALDAALTQADIVVTATGARQTILTRTRVEQAVRVRRAQPLFIIDLAVPRDVEASAGDLEQVFLYNVDDLHAIVDENLSRRGDALGRAEAIVDEETSRFASWMQSRDIIPTVVALRAKFEAVRQAELRRLEPKLAGLPPEARERVDEITRLLVEKLLITPTEQLKAVSDDAMVSAYAEAIGRIFSLPPKESDDEARPRVAP